MSPISPYMRLPNTVNLEYGFWQNVRLKYGKWQGAVRPEQTKTLERYWKNGHGDTTNRL